MKSLATIQANFKPDIPPHVISATILAKRFGISFERAALIAELADIAQQRESR